MIPALNTPINNGLLPLKAAAPLPRTDDNAREQAKAADAQAALEKLKGLEQKARDTQKSMALETINALKQRLKILKSMSTVDAKMIAQLVKELAKAVKAYLAAGGKSADTGAAPSNTPTGTGTDQTAQTPVAATTATPAPTNDKAIAEAKEIHGFVDDVRGFIKKIREVMQRAHEDKDGSLKDTDKDLKEMERDLDEAKAAAGPTVSITV